MNETELVALVEEILEVESGTVDLGDSLADIDWDSLANITFIAEIDSRLGLVVEGDALNQCKTVMDLQSLTVGS